MSLAQSMAAIKSGQRCEFWIVEVDEFPREAYQIAGWEAE